MVRVSCRLADNRLLRGMCVTVNSLARVTEAKDKHEQITDVDVQLERASDVFLGRQLNRSTAKYHLSIDHQELQNVGNLNLTYLSQ